MEMPGCGQVVKVQIFDPHFKHRARISEDAACGCERKNESDPRAAAGRRPDDALNLDARLSQPLAAHLPHCIATDARAEGYLAAEARQIVRENGRRTTECKGKSAGQNFALFRQFVDRKSTR